MVTHHSRLKTNVQWGTVRVFLHRPSIFATYVDMGCKNGSIPTKQIGGTPPSHTQHTDTMASHANISSRGTIENLLNLGFTLYDYLNELNDNALDAGAKTILLRLDTVTRTLTLSDDGKGMDKADLASALCINNTKPASEAIGLRGLGLKAGLVGLSGGLTSTLILSKKRGCEACEVEADWPRAMRENLWNPSPAYLSRHYGAVWDKNKLNDEHGTILQIVLPEETFQGLLQTEKLLAELGRTYELHIRSGVSIQVAVDGVVQFPTMTRAVGYAEAVYKAETPLRLLRNPQTKETRVYYIHQSLRPIWTDWVRINPANDKKTLRDHEAALGEGFVCEGEFTLRSVYNPAWNPPVAEGGERAGCDGYIAPCRDRRFLRAIKTEFPASGDYQKRRMYATSRHGLEFTHANDNEIGVQVNKSAVTPEKINPALWAAVQKIVSNWVTKLYKDLREVPEVGPEAAFDLWLKRTRTRVRAIALVQRERFLAELEHWLDDWDGDEDQDLDA